MGHYPERTREICRLYRQGVPVPRIAAQFGVLNPAIYRQLRTGGVLPPYQSRKVGGPGRPQGGGTPGYTDSRLKRSADAIAARERKAVPVPEFRVERDPCPKCGTRQDHGCRHRKALPDRQKDHLAELISQDMTITAAGRAMGLSQQRASALWRSIVADMGAQAI